jgi:transcriptional regulator with XRE-family HTH domain
MAMPYEVRNGFDGLLESLGVRLSPQERAILRERGLYPKKFRPPTQLAVASQLGVSQPYVSNLENNLVRKLGRAAERAARARQASEQQAETFVSLYRSINDEAERAGYVVDELTLRAAEEE